MTALIRQIPEPKPNGFRVMTYNALAQSLVRREQFPTSGGYLKWGGRCQALEKELLGYKPSILTMQEIDVSKLNWWKTILDKLNLDFRFFAPQGRSHGCLIAFAKDKFTYVSHKEILHDGVQTQPSNTHQKTTHNAGLIVQLEGPGFPLVVATTHLYWHPMANYERLRQTINILEQIHEFQIPNVIFGADMNSAPWSPAYQYLVHREISPKTHEYLVESAKFTGFAPAGAGPDKVQNTLITDPTVAVENLLSRALKAKDYLPELQSVYLAKNGQEPPFTNWSEGYKATLDFIFTSGFAVSDLVETLEPEGLPSGFPNLVKGCILPSDHIPIVVNINKLP